MDVNWKEIFSLQSGLTAVFWDVGFIGGITLLWVWMKHRWTQGRAELRKKTKLGLATLACFFASIYFLARMLWTLSGHVSDELSNSLRGHPKLWCEDMGWRWGEVDPTNHLLTFNIRVYNAGSPTVLRDWQLMVKGPNQAPFHALFVQNQSATSVVTSAGITNVLYESNSIAVKALNEPIQRGAMKDGHILFLIPEKSREWVAYSETTCELTFRDVEGNVVTYLFVKPRVVPTR
jgi:hypothetical protein